MCGVGVGGSYSVGEHRLRPSPEGPDRAGQPRIGADRMEVRGRLV